MARGIFIKTAQADSSTFEQLIKGEASPQAMLPSSEKTLSGSPVSRYISLK